MNVSLTDFKEAAKRIAPDPSFQVIDNCNCWVCNLYRTLDNLNSMESRDVEQDRPGNNQHHSSDVDQRSKQQARDI